MPLRGAAAQAGDGGRDVIGMSIKLTGHQALDRKFGELPGAVQKRVLRDALRPAAKTILAAIQRLTRRVSGRTARSYTVRAGKRSRRFPNRVSFVVITSADRFAGERYYVPFAVLGHRAGRSRVPGSRVPQRALEQAGPQARAEAIRLIAAGIQREARRA